MAPKPEKKRRHYPFRWKWAGLSVFVGASIGFLGFRFSGGTIDVMGNLSEYLIFSSLGGFIAGVSYLGRNHRDEDASYDGFKTQTTSGPLSASDFVSAGGYNRSCGVYVDENGFQTPAGRAHSDGY
ncbi:MAG: hypothetical protein ABJO67_02440 [Pseudoruegeria sp.]